MKAFLMSYFYSLRLLLMPNRIFDTIKCLQPESIKVATIEDSEHAKIVDFIYEHSTLYYRGLMTAIKMMQKKVIVTLTVLMVLILFSSSHSSYLPAKIASIGYFIVLVMLIFLGFLPRAHASSGNEPRNLILPTNLTNSTCATLKLAQTQLLQQKVEFTLMMAAAYARLLRVSWFLIILISLILGIVVY